MFWLNKYGRWSFFIFSAALVVSRLFYIQFGPLDLVADEAHYWEWTRRLALSYYSKGPLIAYLIALTTAIGGNTVLAVRFFSPFFLFGGSFFLYRLGKEMFRNTASGVLSGILLQTTLLFAAYGILMTIDSPFVFLWCLALFLFWKAVDTGKPGYLYLTGIVIGLGFLAKYTMLIFFFSAVLFLIFSSKDRKVFRSPHIYLAFFISLLVMSPVIIWNAEHGWVTVLHTGGHIHVKDGLKISFQSLYEFVGSQLGLVTPFLSSLMIYLILKYRRSYSGFAREKKYLLCFSVPVFTFFLLKSIQGKVEANWAMTSYPALFVLSSFYMVEGWKAFGRKTKSFVFISIIFSMLVTALAHFHSLLHIPPGMDPTKRLAGWKELGSEVDLISGDMASHGPFFILSDSYQIAGEVAFYAKGNPLTYCVNLGRRMNQYDLWPGFDRLIGYNAVYVTDGNQEMPSVLAGAFRSYKKKLLVLHTRQHKIMQFTVFCCYDFKGVELQPATSY